MKNPEDSNTKVLIVFYTISLLILVGPILYGYYDWIYTDKRLQTNIALCVSFSPVIFIVGFMIDTVARIKLVTASDAVDSQKVLKMTVTYSLFATCNVILII